MAKETLEAYYRTNYCITYKGTIYPPMRVGEEVDVQLLKLFAQHKVRSLAFISAWNSKSRLQSLEENYTSQAMLIEDLYKHELDFFPDCIGIERRTEELRAECCGVDAGKDDGNSIDIWRKKKEEGGKEMQIPGITNQSLWREESVSVLNVSKAFAASLAFKYGQISILWVDDSNSGLETSTPERTSAFIPQLLFLRELPLKNDECDSHYVQEMCSLSESLHCMEITGVGDGNIIDNFIERNGKKTKAARKKVSTEEI